MTKCFQEFIDWQRREACRQMIVITNSKSYAIVKLSVRFLKREHLRELEEVMFEVGICGRVGVL